MPVLSRARPPGPDPDPDPAVRPDPPDFDAFVLARGRALLGFAYLVTGDRHQAEDIVQEVLARTHLRWSKVARMEAPEAYVRTAITREYLSWRRRRASSEAVLSDVPEHPQAGDVAVSAVDREHMWQLLAGLPATQRAVLVLRFYCDLPDDQIAELLGWARPTVRAQASRALARLRAVITSTAAEEARHG